MADDFEDLIGEFEPPIRSVTICKKGSLWREYDELREQLDAAQGTPRMGQTAETVAVAERIREVEEEMREHSIRFTFKGASKSKLQAIKKRFPPAKGQGGDWDPMAGAAAFIASCSHEPKMSEEQVSRLEDRIGHGQLDKLFSAAWAATTDDTTVPKSVRASAVLNENG
jgi:hypothetical protein